MRSLSVILSLLVAACCAAFAADVVELSAAEKARQGIAAYNRGDYKSAIQLLSARAGAAPEDATVYYYLGNCYLHTKQHKLAARMFAHCVRVSPKSQAGQYALSALESLSASAQGTDRQQLPAGERQHDKALEASRDALISDKPLDKSFNDAVARIKSQRQTLKARIDQIWAELQDDMQSVTTKSANYAAELERLQREAENKVQHEQTRELRFENRLLAPEKIDVRAVPHLPREKRDDSKRALGSLLDYFKPDEPFDPLASDITPEITARFMSINNVFGELSTYPTSARRLAKQSFNELKKSIETKQDLLDQDLYQLKANLIRDIAQINANYGSHTYGKWKTTPASFISASKIPRSEPGNLTPAELEISQSVERAKKGIEQLTDRYDRDVEGLIARAKERVHGMVAQTGQMSRQLDRPSGNIQLVPLGTDLYVRNYVNFGDRPELDAPPAPPSRTVRTQGPLPDKKKNVPAPGAQSPHRK